MTDQPDIYAVLSQWRRGLRSFLRFSQTICRQYDASPATYQLMLVIKDAKRPVDIQMAANALNLAHHSAAELVQKAEVAGHVVRSPDPTDARRSMLTLTPKGDETIGVLALEHGRFLARIRAEHLDALRGLDNLVGDVSATVTSGRDSSSTSDVITPNE